MATSSDGHYVRFGETHLSDDDAVDTGMAKRAIDNLNHIADQYTQTLVNWAPTSTPDYMAPDASITQANDTYYQLWRSGPFDMHVRIDEGEARSHRCACRIYVANGSVGATVATFRAVLSVTGQGEIEREIAGSNVFTTTATSGTYAWKDAGTLPRLDIAQAAAARRSVQTLNAVSGGYVGTIWLRAELAIYGRTANVSNSEPRVAGCYLREYLHP